MVQKQQPSECWPWTGWCHPRSGYGVLSKKDRKGLRAHRVAYYLATGIDPKAEGQDVLHHCDNPICCNPAHLFIGTHLDNMRDRRSKGRAASTQGILNGRAKLTAEDVIAIRAAYKPNTRNNVRDLAITFGLSRRSVYEIGRRLKWAHLP